MNMNMNVIKNVKSNVMSVNKKNKKQNKDIKTDKNRVFILFQPKSSFGTWRGIRMNALSLEARFISAAWCRCSRFGLLQQFHMEELNCFTNSAENVGFRESALFSSEA